MGVLYKLSCNQCNYEEINNILDVFSSSSSVRTITRQDAKSVGLDCPECDSQELENITNRINAANENSYHNFYLVNDDTTFTKFNILCNGCNEEEQETFDSILQDLDWVQKEETTEGGLNYYITIAQENIAGLFATTTATASTSTSSTATASTSTASTATASTATASTATASTATASTGDTTVDTASDDSGGGFFTFNYFFGEDEDAANDEVSEPKPPSTKEVPIVVDSGIEETFNPEVHTLDNTEFIQQQQERLLELLKAENPNITSVEIVGVSPGSVVFAMTILTTDTVINFEKAGLKPLDDTCGDADTKGKYACVNTEEDGKIRVFTIFVIIALFISINNTTSSCTSLTPFQMYFSNFVIQTLLNFIFITIWYSGVIPNNNCNNLRRQNKFAGCCGVYGHVTNGIPMITRGRVHNVTRLKLASPGDQGVNKSGIKIDGEPLKEEIRHSYHLAASFGIGGLLTVLYIFSKGGQF